MHEFMGDDHEDTHCCGIRDLFVRRRGTSEDDAQDGDGRLWRRHGQGNLYV